MSGALDPTFGTGGVTTLDLGGPSSDVAHAVKRGVRTVIAGSANDRMAVVLPGSANFGSSRGRVIVDFDRPAAAFGVATSGTDVIAVGRTGDDFAVVDLDHRGAARVGFGGQGRVRTSFGRPAVARGVAVDETAKLLVVGTVGVGAGSDVALARYDETGRPDQAFGSGGKMVINVSGGADAANAVSARWPAGPRRDLVAGRAGGAVLVAAYLPGGAPDPVGNRKVFCSGHGETRQGITVWPACSFPCE